MGQRRDDGCGQSVCKGKEGKKTGWKTCPLPATEQSMDDKIQRIAAIVERNHEEENENLNDKIQTIAAIVERSHKEENENLNDKIQKIAAIVARNHEKENKNLKNITQMLLDISNALGRIN